MRNPAVSGGVLATTSMPHDVYRRIHEVAQLARSGVDLNSKHPAALALGALAAELPDFFNRLVLGEVTPVELGALARQLADVAGVCARAVPTTDPRDADQCTKVSPGTRLTCLQSLAEGWITAADLCPRCTRRFMAALDAAAGAEEPLTWHHNYRARSGGAS